MIKKREELKLGEAYLPSIFQEDSSIQAWGCPRHPLLHLQIIRSSLMVLYFYCFIPVYFSLERQFVCFVQFCLLLYLLDPSILVWERDTLHFFILNTLMLHLYLLSIPIQLLFLLLALSFYMYLVQSSQFCFEESTLLLHLYLFGEWFK